MVYKWLVAAHVTADLCFLAGLLATWLLLAVSATSRDPAFAPSARRMRHLTLKVVANGGIVASAATGAALLALNPWLLKQPWLWAKLGLVLVLFGLHGMAAARHRRLGDHPNPGADRGAWRAGVGTAIAALGVFVAVVVRPFG